MVAPVESVALSLTTSLGTPDAAAEVLPPLGTAIVDAEREVDPRLAGALGSVLDRLEQGVFLVDAESGVVFANRAAEDLVRERRCLLMEGGALRAVTRRETLALRAAVAACATSRGTVHGPASCDRYVALSDGKGGPPLLAMVATVDGRGDDRPVPLAAVMVADPRRYAPPPARMLRECFGVTAAEAALAREVVAGDGLGACAARLGISPTTARTHLGSVFAKTGTRRQAELVRLLQAARLGVRPR